MHKWMQDAGTNNRVTFSQRKQPIFGDGTSGFCTTQIWVLLLIGWSKFSTNQKLYIEVGTVRHQYGIFSLVSQASFHEETTGGVMKCGLFSQAAIRHLHISHNAPYLPPKIFHKLCFSFLLSITAVPREVENNMLNAKLWGTDKVHYGRCASGQYLSRMHWNELTNGLTDLA